ncbi:uncharacterized protein TNIN_109191 [Trichonephila inaurata madagascariensis]|uniref:Uncharacterized protein n=1 Tax=Trichonephila inaurata madagascariensis TaxID=2747483 RepID=A0A8X6YBY4_9ARAC|nr:uncharacterized protein TNIN_109191 [Trichonephila inaurata madagascariensis]
MELQLKLCIFPIISEYNQYSKIKGGVYSPPPGPPSPGPRLSCLYENDQRDEEGCSERAEEHRRLPTSHESTVINLLRPCLSLARHTPAREEGKGVYNTPSADDR